MKNKSVMFLRVEIMSVLIGSLCFAELAMAQGGYSAKPAPVQGASAAPGASATATPRPGGEISMIPRKADNPSKTAGGLSAADKSFMTNAAKGGMMEVEGGKMAAANSQNADVKKFGNRMVADHSKANDELKAIAAKKGVSLPNAKEGMSWKSDKKYMDMMVKDHEKDLAEFQQEAKNGSDADVKKFADKTAKVVQKHLAMAKEIDGKLK
jgi:putative membrane protein